MREGGREGGRREGVWGEERGGEGVSIPLY